jgi:hypothetical protein
MLLISYTVKGFLARNIISILTNSIWCQLLLPGIEHPRLFFYSRERVFLPVPVNLEELHQFNKHALLVAVLLGDAEAVVW